MISASADHLSGPAGFSTSDGLGKSFLYPGGSRNGETGRSSKTLFASSKKGQRWMAWLPSHSLQGDLALPFCLENSLSLVDSVHSTWLSEVDATELCKRGDQSLSIRGMQGQSLWKWSPLHMTHGDLGLVSAVCGFLSDDTCLPPVAFGSFFFFSFFFFSFFSLGTWFFVLPVPSSEEEGGEEDEVEGSWATLVWSNCWLDC